MRVDQTRVRAGSGLGGSLAASDMARMPYDAIRANRTVCDRVLPASHVTFASEKREWALPEGSCDVDVGLDLSLVQNRSTNTVDALAVRLAFDRYGDKNKATRPNRLPPGRTVLALGDLNLFEWNEDGCDSEVCGRLVGEHTAGGSDGLSFARFESVVQILDSWRRVAGEKKAGGKTPKTRAGVGAPALVPPELFTNATLMKLFRGRSGQVAVVGDDSRTGGDDYRDNDNDSYLMSISQWLFLLRDANVLDGAFSPAGACVIFARARSGGGNDTTGTAQLADLSLRFVPDFVCAVALVASAKGWSVEDVLGRMVCTAAPASEQIGNLRKCFALLDATRSGFISTRDLPKALCAGGWLAHLSLEDGFCFLRNRVDGLSADKGYVAPIDEFPGVVSLAECELHAFAASRVPKSSGNRLEPTDRETIAVSDVLSSEVANVFHRVCCAGVEAGFTTQPHPKLMDETRFLTCLKSVPDLHSANFTTGAGVVAFATAAAGRLRLDENGFRSALGLIAKHKGIEPHDLFEHVKRCRLSNLTSGAFGNRNELTQEHGVNSSNSKASFAYETNEMADGAVDAVEETKTTVRKKNPPRRALPLDPGPIRVPIDSEKAHVLLNKSSPIIASNFVCIAADVGALDGIALSVAGDALEGAICTLMNASGSCTLQDSQDFRIDKQSAITVLNTLADIRGALLRNGQMEPPPPPTPTAHETDHRLRFLFTEWSLPEGASTREIETTQRRIENSWERSCMDATATWVLERGIACTVATDAILTNDSRINPSTNRNRNPLNSAPPCSRSRHFGKYPTDENADTGRTRFACNPTKSAGMDWSDEHQLLGRHDTSGLDKARRMRIPDVRRVGFSTAHVTRKGAAATTKAAMRTGACPMATPSLGTAGANEGRWDAIHGKDARGGTDEDLKEHANASSIASSGSAARSAAWRANALAGERLEIRKNMSLEELTQDDVLHRGSSALALDRAAALQSAAEQGAHASKQTFLPSSGVSNVVRAGMSMASFRKLVVQAGLTGPQLRDSKHKNKNTRLTPAAADVAFALARAPGAYEMTWGEFLSAIGRLAQTLDESFGDVALRLRKVGAPKPTRRPPPAPRVSFVPAPCSKPTSGNAHPGVFDVETYASACDNAHASVVRGSVEHAAVVLSPTLAYENLSHSVAAEFEPKETEFSRLGPDSLSLRKQTLVQTFVSTKRVDRAQEFSRLESLDLQNREYSPTLPQNSRGASTWRLETSRLDMGNSLVASLRASAYYDRDAHARREK